MKKVFIRDLPLGILLIVLAQYSIYWMWNILDFPSTSTLLLVLFLAILTDRLVGYGIKLILGFNFRMRDKE